MPLVWAAQPYMNYATWWTCGIASLYAGILHPAIIHYRWYLEKNKNVLDASLCSSCRYFDRTAVLCLLHDSHPTSEFLPCDGLDWQPGTSVSITKEADE